MGFTQVGLVTTDSFCETVRAGFVANEQEISETFGEWFTNCANENKMVTKDNIVAPIIVNKQMLTLSLSKEMQEPLSRALKKAIKEALDEALDENKVLTETNFAEALDKNKVLLTETNLKSTLQTELERNKLYKLAIKDQLAIKVVQCLAFVLTFHFQHPRLGPLLRAMPTEFCRLLCSLACPLLAAVLAGQTFAILARAVTMQTP